MIKSQQYKYSTLPITHNANIANTFILHTSIYKSAVVYCVHFNISGKDTHVLRQHQKQLVG